MRPAIVGVGLVVVIGLALRGHNASRATAPVNIAPPDDPSPIVTVAPSPAVKETGRRVIASAKTDDNQCKVPGAVNGAALTLQIDTGSPGYAEFAASYIRKLGIDPASLQWAELDPGTRYGKIAHATAREIRIGDVVWNDAPIRFFSNWRFSFGDDEIPLFGLSGLNAKGVSVEFEGGYCRLTVKRAAR